MANPSKAIPIEDLRLMIGQEVGLKHLIPIALNHLKKQPLAEGDYYPGDLLAAVIRIPESFWQSEPALKKKLVCVLGSALKCIHKVDTIESLEAQLLNAREKFTT